jgi:integrase/recombinase XerC
LLPKKIIDSQKVFRVLSNQKTNEHLKEIIKIAEIEKNITFHSARHTLATIGLEKGIPIEVISKILGHTEIKMTQIYAKVNDSLKYQEMQKLDKKANK